MNIEEALSLTEQIMEEHKRITHGMQSLEEAANDASALSGLEKAKEAFMPGRFEQTQGLQKLAAQLEMTEKGLQAHFNREETALLAVFEEHGNEELASVLRPLLLEHADLRSRINHSQKHVAELAGGGLSRHVWETNAYDMRAHISHTRKLLEAHAGIERELLLKLREHLQVEK